MSAPKTKYHYDVKNVFTFPLTVDDDGTATYGTAEKQSGIISLDLSAEGDNYKQRADGIDYVNIFANNGYTGDINFVMVPEAFKQSYLGETMDDTDKVLVEKSDAMHTPFAIAFEFKGDVKGRRHIFYNCTANRPNVAGENKDNAQEADTETISIVATPLDNGMVKASTTEDTPAAVFDAWNTTPYIHHRRGRCEIVCTCNTCHCWTWDDGI